MRLNLGCFLSKGDLDMTNDKIFIKKLTRGEFSTAFDPIARRYVTIRGVEKKPSGNVIIYASRVSDPVIEKYNSFQLKDYR